jgi:hypothetical protein
MPDPELCPSQVALLDEATQIIAMAKDLQAHGKHIEADQLALVVQQRLTAIKAIGRMNEAMRQLKERPHA